MDHLQMLETLHVNDTAHQLCLVLGEGTVANDLFPKLRCLSGFMRCGPNQSKLAWQMMVITRLAGIPTESPPGLKEEYERLRTKYDLVREQHPVNHALLHKTFMKGVDNRFYYELVVVHHFLQISGVLADAIWMQFGFGEHNCDFAKTKAGKVWRIISDPINTYHSLLMDSLHELMYRDAYSDAASGFDAALPGMAGGSGMWHSKWSAALRSAVVRRRVRGKSWLVFPHPVVGKRAMEYAKRHFPSSGST